MISHLQRNDGEDFYVICCFIAELRVVTMNRGITIVLQPVLRSDQYPPFVAVQSTLVQMYANNYTITVSSDTPLSPRGNSETLEDLLIFI